MENKVDSRFVVKGRSKVVNGSVLNPENAGLRVIVNFVGLDGSFNAALDKALTNKWLNVRKANYEWYSNQFQFKAGNINTTAVASDVFVCNVLARGKDGKIDPKALTIGIKKLADYAKYEKASVHVSSLLSDEVPELAAMLTASLVEAGVNVYYYQDTAK
jgi:hypothetical protein